MKTQLDDTRNFNFRILRNLRGRHEDLVRELRGIANDNDVSAFYLARRPIPECTARVIEVRLNLPMGWLDRKFEAYFGATGTQHEIIELIFRAAPDVLEAIKTIMRHADPQAANQQPVSGARLSLVK